jgi:hypothetical protein
LSRAAQYIVSSKKAGFFILTPLFQEFHPGFSRFSAEKALVFARGRAKSEAFAHALLPCRDKLEEFAPDSTQDMNERSE